MLSDGKPQVSMAVRTVKGAVASSEKVSLNSATSLSMVWSGLLEDHADSCRSMRLLSHSSLFISLLHVIDPPHPIRSRRQLSLPS
jgi:hypothetical protein